MQTAFSNVKQSTFYAVLRRIQADGFAESYTSNTSGGPVREMGIL